MQTTAQKPTIMERIHEHRLAITGTASSIALVGAASAGTLADNVSPILQDVTSLMDPLLSLIIGAVPLIVAISVIGFILGILAAILGKLKV